jgi:hypothetical protein
MEVLYIFGAILLGAFLIMGLISIANLSFAPKFDLAFANEKIICLIQVKKSSDDDLGLIVHSHYWLHVVDAANLRRLFKVRLGRDKIKVVKLEGSQVLIEINKQASSSEFKIMDAYTWQLVREYSEKTMPVLFPEFSLGLADRIRYSEEYEMLMAYAKDGKSWYIEAFEKSIIAGDEMRKKSYRKVIVPAVELVGEKIKYVKDYKTNQINQALPFIEGRLMATDKVNKRCFIVSYDTTDKKDAKLFCLSFDQEIVWQTSPTVLKFKSHSSKFADFDVLCPIGDKVFFNYGGFLYLAKIDNGNIIVQNQIS